MFNSVKTQYAENLHPEYADEDQDRDKGPDAAPAAPATSHGLMETSDGPVETIHGLPTTSRPSNTVPPGTGEQGPGEVGITPETSQGAATKCQGNPRRSESQKCLSKGHLTPPGTSAPVAQLMDPATFETNSGTSGRPAAGLRKRQAAPAPTLPPKSRRTDTNAGEDMDVERGPRIPPIILDVPKGWASHAVTIKQLVGGDLEANGHRFDAMAEDEHRGPLSATTTVSQPPYYRKRSSRLSKEMAMASWRPSSSRQNVDNRPACGSSPSVESMGSGLLLMSTPPRLCSSAGWRSGSTPGLVDQSSTTDARGLGMAPATATVSSAAYDSVIIIRPASVRRKLQPRLDAAIEERPTLPTTVGLSP
ncbi:hypothetical protein J6590_094804 [Homalodisca vitripennis]|nr:hypothetical protein J6590_094804 [Homalodisca vitripennis]